MPRVKDSGEIAPIGCWISQRVPSGRDNGQPAVPGSSTAALASAIREGGKFGRSWCEDRSRQNLQLQTPSMYGFCLIMAAHFKSSGGHRLPMLPKSSPPTAKARSYRWCRFPAILWTLYTHAQLFATVILTALTSSVFYPNCSAEALQRTPLRRRWWVSP